MIENEHIDICHLVHCSKCGAKLKYMPWNTRVDIAVCDNYLCQAFRHPTSIPLEADRAEKKQKADRVEKKQTEPSLSKTSASLSSLRKKLKSSMESLD